MRIVAVGGVEDVVFKKKKKKARQGKQSNFFKCSIPLLLHSLELRLTYKVRTNTILTTIFFFSLV